MPASYLPPQPVASPAVEMAVTTLQTESSAATLRAHTIRIYLRSTGVLPTPATYVTDNGLEHVVVSLAGLNESTTFEAYSDVSATSGGGFQGEYYVYVIDAIVDLGGD